MSSGANLVLYLGTALVVATIFNWTRQFHGVISEDLRRSMGAILGFAAISFSLLLGFMVSYFLTRFLDIERTLVDEVTQLQLIYRMLKPLPESAPIISALRTYVQSVITEEWPALQRGESSPRTEALQAQFSELLIQYFADPQHSVTLGQVVLAKLSTGEWRKRLATVLRANRFLISVIAIAGFITLLGFWLYHHRTNIYAFLVDFVIISLVALGLFLLVVLNRPFAQSNLGVSPLIYEDLLREIDISAPEPHLP